MFRDNIPTSLARLSITTSIDRRRARHIRKGTISAVWVTKMRKKSRK
jgi:hypothetical protein